MKNFSFILILGLLLFMLTVNTLAQTYAVEVITNDAWWSSKENFFVNMTAVIYENGNPIPYSTNYYYWWYIYDSHSGGGYQLLYQGFDLHNANHETIKGGSIDAYVLVTDSVNHYFSKKRGNADGPYSLPEQGAKSVYFYAYQQNGGYILPPTVQPNHWRYTIDQWRDNYYSLLTWNYDERIRSTPDYATPSPELY